MGKKLTALKVFTVSMVGGFVGKFIYDEYVKDTPAVDVAKAKIHSVSEKMNNVVSLFEKEEQPVESEEYAETFDAEDFEEVRKENFSTVRDDNSEDIER